MSLRLLHPLARGAWRRWAVVLAGAVLLGSIPAVVAAIPVPASAVSAAALRARILASGSVPYEAYAESIANFGLPQLPDVGDVSTLLDGTTDQYVWYRSPAYWRAEEVTAAGQNAAFAAGESDAYTDGGVTYLWSYGRNVLTQVLGAQPVRLPRAPDLLPPALALRLLHIAGRDAHFTRLPTRRIAGIAAAGLRIVPADSATTIASIEIWADPRTGLPAEVQLTARGAAHPALTSTFLELSERRPTLDQVTPHPAAQIGIASAKLPDVDNVLNGDGDGDGDHTPFPARLAGQGYVPLPGSPPGVAIYGAGLSRFVLLPLPRGEGPAAYNAAVSAGAQLVTLGSQATAGPGGATTGAVIRTPLLSVLLMTAGFHHTTFAFAGAVSPPLLENAANGFISDLASRFRRPR